MDGGELFPTDEGVPQGGVASPLLANVALHGFEEAIMSAFPHRRIANVDRRRPTVIRYADEFVVFHRDLAVIERVKQVASEWLAGMGLEMKPSKTRVTHTLHQHEGQVGFDFLGFTVRQYKVGKTHAGKSSARSSHPLGFKTIIKPSAEAVHRHSRALQEVVSSHKTAPQSGLIAHINPIIRGWARYYSTVVSKSTFGKLDNLTYCKLQHWARQRHPNKSRGWVARKYLRLEMGRWDFATREGMRLYNHSAMPIRRHVKVRGDKSFYDGDWVYWASRLGKHPELPGAVATLLKGQKGRCARCGLYFKEEDLPAAYRQVQPTTEGNGGGTRAQLLHRHCHEDEAAELKAAVRGTRDQSQAIEEPDEAKVSRPVL